MIEDLLTAIALMLVIEGILPFLSPAHTRRALFQIVQQNDKTLRLTGLATMAIGLTVLYLVRH
jgi:uncharacterized protein YjeT (DUF2065 family)